ncbi:hypothetical protein HYU50_01090 [Candidatus Woesearchaeota archaeon]|nr:hypothetical protein [Candidatus Woesearchaeota archaeon]
MKIRAQSALEYIMIIALTLAIIVPATYLFFRYTSESNTQILDSQISQMGRGMIDTAENVYFSGQNSKIVLQFNMPESVNDIYIIGNRELVFNITTAIGENEAVFFSSVNITSSLSNCQGERCSLSEIADLGLNKISFQSYNNGKQVLISKYTE